MLTDKQREFAEKNHRLIYSFLRKYSLPYEEWYGVAAIGFCEAVLKFNPQRGVKFPVFAYHVMLNRVRAVKRDSKAIKRSALVVSLQDELYDGITIEQTLAYKPDCIDMFIREDIVNFIGSLTPRHRLILALCAAGNTQKKISEKVGVSQAYVSRIIRKLKKRFSLIA